jgi:peptidoglycan-associated lipoprotein
MKNIPLLILLFILGGQLLHAQPIRKSSYEMTLVAARESYAKQDYINALERYKEAYEEKQDKALIDTIAWMSYKIRDYRSAERWFARMLRRDKENEYNDYRYVYGQLMIMNEKYSEGIEELQKFLETAKGDSIRTLATNMITGAELALELPPNLKGVTVENAGKRVNSKTSEYTPSVSGNGKELYFSSIGADDVVYVDEESQDDSFSKIYVAAKDDNGWEKPKELDEKINRPDFHNSNVNISPDGRTLFFTRSLLQGNKLAEAKIFYSTGGSEGWAGAEEVKGVNGDYIAKHPAPGELFAKEVLFFSSDMDGGYGGFDLYYATKTAEGEYSEPVNLGAIINTPGDEETPHYREGTLYFSSSGHPGLGGFDIFYATWDGSAWSTPLNMGRGYNTSVDDYGLTLDEEGYFGMLASNRPGGKSAYGRTCCDDLYQVDIERIVVDLLVGIFDEDRKPVFGGSTVHLVPMENDVMGKPTTQQIGEKSNGTGFDLALEMPYMLIANHPDFYPDTATFNTVGLIESTTLEQKMYLKRKPPPPPPPPLFDTLEIEEAIVLENILYDFDDDRIKEESEADLQIVYDLMQEYPDMVIELGSHTDKEGNNSYNEGLSQRRAESARRWLVRKGINRDRIKAKGYGENQPQTVSKANASKYDFLKEGDILTEEFILALETEEQQDAADALNRRTEFKIIEGPRSIIMKRIIKKETKEDAPDRGSFIQGIGPKMEFTERYVHLGKVKRGEKRTYTFEFVNAGDAELTIDLISACECTTITNDPTGNSFKPGEKGTIEFVFDSTEKEESEVIDIDIFLLQEDKNGMQLRETVQYEYELIR